MSRGGPISTSMWNVAGCVEYLQEALAERADPDKAMRMQAYMKTVMPFYGVQKPERKPILAKIVTEYRPADRDEYEALVTALWALPHREEKYLAQGVARFATNHRERFSGLSFREATKHIGELVG